MISVSRVYACDSLLEGLRAPPLTGLPSPAAMANGATQTATTMALAMTQRRRDMWGAPLIGDRGSPTRNRSAARGSRCYVTRQTRDVNLAGARVPRSARARAGRAGAAR